MKQLAITLAAFFLFATLHAQVQDPVKWNYSAVKKSDKEYVVTISATLSSDWHIYSMNTPDGGPVATLFTFKKNPLINFTGKVTENGNLKTVHDDIFGVDVKYYGGSVTYVQQIVLKSPVKTNLTGSVKYMVCNEKMCLPPKTVPFNIQIQ
jgi:hypothetical protein